MTIEQVFKILSTSIIAGIGIVTAVWLIGYTVRALINIMRGGDK